MASIDQILNRGVWTELFSEINNSLLIHNVQSDNYSFFIDSQDNSILYTDKKENRIFLIYKEIQSGAVAKSYMTNGLLNLIYGEIFVHFLIY